MLKIQCKIGVICSLLLVFDWIRQLKSVYLLDSPVKKLSYDL